MQNEKYFKLLAQIKAVAHDFLLMSDFSETNQLQALKTKTSGTQFLVGP